MIKRKTGVERTTSVIFVSVSHYYIYCPIKNNIYILRRDGLLQPLGKEEWAECVADALPGWIAGERKNPGRADAGTGADVRSGIVRSI